MVELPSFQNAQLQLLNFLDRGAEYSEICWVFRGDFYSTSANNVVVAQILPVSNPSLASEAYTSAVAARIGVQLHAEFGIDSRVYCWVDAPDDGEDSERRLCSDGLRFSRRDPWPCATRVSGVSWLWRRWFSRVYRRYIEEGAHIPRRSSPVA